MIASTAKSFLTFILIPGAAEAVEQGVSGQNHEELEILASAIKLARNAVYISSTAAAAFAALAFAAPKIAVLFTVCVWGGGAAACLGIISLIALSAIWAGLTSELMDF